MTPCLDIDFVLRKEVRLGTGSLLLGELELFLTFLVSCLFSLFE